METRISSRFHTVLLLEWSINLFFWIGWILLINSGTENGIGYFHQPKHDLIWPLLYGALFNAITFTMVCFFLAPVYLAKRLFWRFFLGLGLLIIVVLLSKTVCDLLIIALQMPELEDISFAMLMLENFYILPFLVLFALAYRFARDWFSVTKLMGQGSETNWSARDGTGNSAVILVKSGSKVHRILVDNILYIKSDGNYVIFVDAQKRVMSHQTMAEVLQRLPEGRFLRVHRSYIVAIAHIDTIEAGRIKIHDRYIPIGGKFREAFLAQMEFT